MKAGPTAVFEARPGDAFAPAAGTVNLFGLLAMFAWPVIGTCPARGEVSYGVRAGTSIHAVPQVVGGSALAAGLFPTLTLATASLLLIVLLL